MIASERTSRRRIYSGWPLRRRLELLAFDARLTDVPPGLLEALWEVIDRPPLALLSKPDLLRRET
jgi:hypothetical protein